MPLLNEYNIRELLNVDIYGTSKLINYPFNSPLGDYIGNGCFLSHNYVMVPFHCLSNTEAIVYMEKELDFAIIRVTEAEECFPSCHPCTLDGNITLFAGIEKWKVLKVHIVNEFCAEVWLSEELQFGDSGMIVYGEADIRSSWDGEVEDGEVPLFIIIARNKYDNYKGLAVSLPYILNYIRDGDGKNPPYARNAKPQPITLELAKKLQNIYGLHWNQWEFISDDYPTKLSEHVNKEYEKYIKIIETKKKQHEDKTGKLFHNNVDKLIIENLKKFTENNVIDGEELNILQVMADKYITTTARELLSNQQLMIKEGRRILVKNNVKNSAIKKIFNKLEKENYSKTLLNKKKCESITNCLKNCLDNNEYNKHNIDVNEKIKKAWEIEKEEALKKMKLTLIQLYKIFYIAKLNIHDTDSDILDTDHCWVLEFEQKHSISTGLYKLVSDFMEACKITNIDELQAEEQNVILYTGSSRAITMSKTNYEVFKKPILQKNATPQDNTACHHPFLCELTKACRGVTITHCCIRPSHLVKLNKKFNDYCTVLQDFYAIGDNLNVSWTKTIVSKPKFRVRVIRKSIP